jgi:hypothetical protein
VACQRASTRTPGDGDHAAEIAPSLKVDEGFSIFERPIASSLLSLMLLVLEKKSNILCSL